MSNPFTQKPYMVFGTNVLRGDYTIQLMLDGKVIDADATIYPGIKEARKAAAIKLKASDIEKAYVRVVKVGDPTIIDFITRSRMATRNYIGFDKDDPDYHAKLKELKNARNLRKRRNYPRPTD